MKFIAEGELGRLAKRLVMLGFDCCYDGGMSLVNAMQKAALEERILLSRKPLTGTKRTKVLRITSAYPNEQLLQIAAAFRLYETADPFSRCLVCNVRIEELKDYTSAPDSMDNGEGVKVPESVIERGLVLYQCPECRRIYWHGSHIKRMKAMLAGAGFELK